MPSTNRQNDNRNLIIWVIVFFVIAMIAGQQFMTMQGAANGDENRPRTTDTLLTSEFLQAIEQDRVESVVYDARNYTVTGTYYPAITAGQTGVDAFSEAISALSAALPRAAQGGEVDASTGIGVTSLSATTLGEKHNYTSTYVGQESLAQLVSRHPQITYEVTLPMQWLDILSAVLPLLLFGVLIWIFFSQMQKANNQQMGFGKTKAKKAHEERPDVKFDDVAGVDEAVEEMTEIKDFLANPEKYQALGAKIPRGCLLVGPPGTGKTLLARAVAGEAGVPFFSISGSDFVEMFVGVGASRVRDLFQQAKEASPSIIFIDEIDAVGRQRGAGLGGGHDEREQTLNQLLVEMDGFDQNDSVVLIAATNRSDILDPALLRPGRFDRQIVVDVPDVKGREKILQVHAADKPIGSDVDLQKIASLTPGFTGADLMNLMNESALLTARRGKKIITMQEVTESMERVIAGPERKSHVMNEDTRRIIAYHESGHALVGHSLAHADPVHKISIISRGRALGYTMSIPDEDKVLNSLSEMRDQLAVLMGGRVAEEIFCGDITTGASNDLERATKMARSIVTQYGMSPLGHQVFGQPNHEVFLGRDYGNTQDYSEETARRIDDEVARIMREAHERAYEILSTHPDQMHLMATVLLERETVDGEACKALLDNKWDEYLAREDEIIARKEAEEAAARARDERLADPNWRDKEQAAMQSAYASQQDGSIPQGQQPFQAQQLPQDQQPFQAQQMPQAQQPSQAQWQQGQQPQDQWQQVQQSQTQQPQDQLPQVQQPQDQWQQVQWQQHQQTPQEQWRQGQWQQSQQGQPSQQQELPAQQSWQAQQAQQVEQTQQVQQTQQFPQVQQDRFAEYDQLTQQAQQDRFAQYDQLNQQPQQTQQSYGDARQPQQGAQDPSALQDEEAHRFDPGFTQQVPYQGTQNTQGKRGNHARPGSSDGEDGSSR